MPSIKNDIQIPQTLEIAVVTGKQDTSCQELKSTVHTTMIEVDKESILNECARLNSHTCILVSSKALPHCKDRTPFVTG
jgi:hypothetical protein